MPPTQRPRTDRDSPAFTRDYRSTISDDEMNIALYNASPAIDQALQTLQREMARPYSSDETKGCLNSMLLAFSQIHSRLAAFYERGQALTEQRKTTQQGE